MKPIPKLLLHYLESDIGIQQQKKSSNLLNEDIRKSSKKKSDNKTNNLNYVYWFTGSPSKTFVIMAISYITRRVFCRNGSVMNLPPTGSASNLLPDGRVHSTLPTLWRSKDFKSAQMTEHPFSHKHLKKLRRIIGFNNNCHQLYCLNMDERSISHRLLAWSSQRLCEATNEYNQSFGNVPIMNFFGDIGQLGPIGAKESVTKMIYQLSKKNNSHMIK